MKKVGAILLILVAGLIHGLLYVFLVPPWQHYDEPTHFEVAWLIANRAGLPSTGEYDQAMRREVAASMVEHGFFKDLNLSTNLLAQNEPVWIGISQTDNPPLYYWIAALPLRLVPTSDITFQLILCRLVSLLFYLLTILTASWIVSELTPPGHLLRWMVPATLVLLPGFTELMTAVNSDVGAVAFFSLFIWASLRLIQRGFNLMRLGAAGLLAVACLLTKNTAAIALPLFVISVLFSLLRGRKAWLAWTLLGAGISLSVFILFTSGDVAKWYQLASQNLPTRAASSLAPLGSFAFQLEAASSAQTNSLVQPLSPSQVIRLRGKTITLGFWMWASQPGRYRSPALKDDRQSYSELVDVNLTPAFHTLTAKLASTTNHIQIVLQPSGAAGVRIFIDGLVLARGDYSHSGSPVLMDAEGQHGAWGGKAFANPIRNASAEQNWPRPRTPIQRLLNKLSPIQPNMVLASLADWQNSRWYYQTTLKQLFRTLWGEFGWGHIPLPRQAYIALSIVTALGVLAGLTGLLRNRKTIPWEAFALLAISSLWIWGAALVRGVYSVTWTVFIPSARYAFPAIIPTVWVLCAGWAEGPRWIERWLRIPGWVKLTFFLALFLLLDALSIWTIARFYGKL